MTPREYCQRRNRYSYPTVGLRGSLNQQFRTSYALDRYHSASLQSVIKERMIGGYLSIIYWGHVSGKNGRLNHKRALSKVQQAKHHITNVFAATRIIKNARKMIKDNQCAAAILELAKLPQLGFAFASKVCAFLSGEHCGVIDSVIARQYPHFGFQVNSGGYVKTNDHNAKCYRQYCKFLQSEAASMNRLGSCFMWRDRDGTIHKWRAVDIERAMYG